MSEDTWEDMVKLQLEFPDFSLKDNVSFNGGGINGIQEWEIGEEVSEVQTNELGVLNHEEQRNREGLLEQNGGRPKRATKRSVRYLD